MTAAVGMIDRLRDDSGTGLRESLDFQLIDIADPRMIAGEFPPGVGRGKFD